MWYQTQERAMAPGISDGWPKIIPAPHTDNGRLKRMEGDPEEWISCMETTLQHKLRVADLLVDIAHEIMKRAVHHDDSKFSKAEFKSFAEVTSKLKELTYGSDEYKSYLEKLKPVLDHHYSYNDHHPEHFADSHGIHDMNLIQLIEMLCDWKAATERHNDGDLTISIEKNAERFGYGKEIENLLLNTANDLGLLS